MAKEKEYEYHKRNEYPGERVAEKKRVADREAEAERKADVRVAEKGRTEGLKANNRVARKGREHDKLMDSEVETSTRRAARVNRSRNSADMIGIIVFAGIIFIMLGGMAWGYSIIQQQNKDITSLNSQVEYIIANGVQFSGDENRQVQLYNDLLVATSDVNLEIKALEEYNKSYSNTYQLCANYAERENNVNHALNRFAEKKIVYYKQIAVLSNKPHCEPKIDAMSLAIAESKNADEQLFIQNMRGCDEITGNTFGEGSTIASRASSMNEWEVAFDESIAKTKALIDAEMEVIACLG